MRLRVALLLLAAACSKGSSRSAGHDAARAAAPQPVLAPPIDAATVAIADGAASVDEPDPGPADPTFDVTLDVESTEGSPSVDVRKLPDITTYTHETAYPGELTLNVSFNGLPPSSVTGLLEVSCGKGCKVVRQRFDVPAAECNRPVGAHGRGPCVPDDFRPAVTMFLPDRHGHYTVKAKLGVDCAPHERCERVRLVATPGEFDWNP